MTITMHVTRTVLAKHGLPFEDEPDWEQICWHNEPPIQMVVDHGVYRGVMYALAIEGIAALLGFVAWWIWRML